VGVGGCVCVGVWVCGGVCWVFYGMCTKYGLYKYRNYQFLLFGI
jgi:hypothetical protein